MVLILWKWARSAAGLLGALVHGRACAMGTAPGGKQNASPVASSCPWDLKQGGKEDAAPSRQDRITAAAVIFLSASYKLWLMLWGSFLCLSWNALLSTWVKSSLTDRGSSHHSPNQGWHSLHFSAQIVRNPGDSRLPEDWDGPKHLSRGRCLRSGKFLKAEQRKPDILWAESFKKSVKTGRGWSCWRGATAAICILQHWRKKQIYKAPQPRFFWWNYFINGCDICNVSLFKFKYCCFYSYS